MLRDTYSKALRLWKEYDAALSYSEVALLRLRHGQFLSLWTRLKTDKGQSVHELTEDFWFDTWLTSFDNIEARWLWTKRVMDEARERPDALADWALVRDDASLH
jgi:hypothetical protein